SVGSVYAFVSMIFVVLMPSLGVTGAFIAAMALSFAIGWLNGWLTWHYKLPSLLVTLGFLFFYRGLVEYVTGGVTMVMDDELRSSPIVSFLGAKFLGLHVSIYLCALLVLVFTVVLTKT